MTEQRNGNCFEVAARMVLNMVKEAEEQERNDVERGLSVLNSIRENADEVRLLHGVVERQTDKLLHLHAWVEVDINGETFCLDFANERSFFMKERDFYEAGVCLTTSYDEQAIKKAIVEHETWGPWHLSEPDKANERRKELGYG